MLALSGMLTGCLEPEESHVLNSEAPDAFRKPRPPIVVAYMHIGNRNLDIRKIDLQGVDIVNLAFTVITNNKMGLLNPKDSKNFNVARLIKQKYPNIKVLVSVGGYGTAKDFSNLCMQKSSRAVFVDDAVRFVRAYGLDGLDVDWEFPGMDKETREADRVNFTAFMKELRSAFDDASHRDGKRYYLTVASGAFDLYLTYTEPLKVAPLVDYFFVMTYDFYGQWNKNTGHHTNLFPSALKPGGFSVDRIITNYRMMGIPREKIVIGAAFYGRQWNNVESTNHGLYKPGRGVGSVTYTKIKTLLNSKSGFFRYWDKEACAPYLYNPNSKVFVSYEDGESLDRKVDYVFYNSLGGIMYWEYYSDYNGELSSAIIEHTAVLRGDRPVLKVPGGFIIKKRKK